MKKLIVIFVLLALALGVGLMAQTPTPAGAPAGRGGGDTVGRGHIAGRADCVVASDQRTRGARYSASGCLAGWASAKAGIAMQVS